MWHIRIPSKNCLKLPQDFHPGLKPPVTPRQKILSRPLANRTRQIKSQSRPPRRTSLRENPLTTPAGPAAKNNPSGLAGAPGPDWVFLAKTLPRAGRDFSQCEEPVGRISRKDPRALLPTIRIRHQRRKGSLVCRTEESRRASALLSHYLVNVARMCLQEDTRLLHLRKGMRQRPPEKQFPPVNIPFWGKFQAAFPTKYTVLGIVRNGNEIKTRPEP